jgi:hypothetical protein
MFHEGEVVSHQAAPDVEWEDFTVINGYCDWPVKRLLFAWEPGQRPYWFERANPPGVLAVLRRQSDGARFMLESATFELVEQREPGMRFFDSREAERVPSQFGESDQAAGPAPARRVISVNGRTLREPASGD